MGCRVDIRKSASMNEITEYGLPEAFNSYTMNTMN